MFRKRMETIKETPTPTARVTSVLGSGISWKGALRGIGGVRIEGAFDGEITIKGILVVGETGRVTCPQIQANTVIIAGAVQGNITAEKVEIRSTGRVWGDVVTTKFSTEEGAFLRGKIRMEDEVSLDVPTAPSEEAETQQPEESHEEPTPDDEA